MVINTIILLNIENIKQTVQGFIQTINQEPLNTVDVLYLKL